MGALSSQPRAAIAATAALVRYYRAFLRSNKRLAPIPGDPFRSTMDKADARRRLATMLDRAIGLKVGSEPTGRKHADTWQRDVERDAQKVADKRERRVIIRSFDTVECRRRLAHLVTAWGD